jgi:hypothetical protein
MVGELVEPPVEPEAVFGQIKANKQYNRFRHFGLDKVKMDFGIFAIAFNIGKMYNKAKIMPKNQKKSLFFIENMFIIVFVGVLYEKSRQHTKILYPKIFAAA